MRSLVYYVAVSLDGFIAAGDGSTAALSADPDYVAELARLLPETIPTHLRHVLGADLPAARFDSVLLGRRTHQIALDAGLTSGYPHLEQHVFSTRAEQPDDPTVHVHRTDPVSVMRQLRCRPGRDIWLCGGGNLAGQLVGEIDEYLLKVNPVVLGAGIPLLGGAACPAPCRLLSTRLFDTGVVMLHYRRAT